MKCDILVAGVGGQGVLLVSTLIASNAMKEALHVKQSEVHGMSQRGGAVVAHLRLSDAPIHSDLIPHGTADLILGMEPVESLRSIGALKPDGTLLTASDPVVNVPDYPAVEEILSLIRWLPHGVLVEAGRIARECGSARSTNVVMVGAASHFLPFAPEGLEARVRETFSRKGERLVEANLRAFRAGREAVRCVAA